MIYEKRGKSIETKDKVLTNVLKLVLKVVAIKNFFSIYDKHIILMKYYLPLNLDSKSTVQRNPVNVLP